MYNGKNAVKFRYGRGILKLFDSKWDFSYIYPDEDRTKPYWSSNSRLREGAVHLSRLSLLVYGCNP